jgi:eukaryotic-like serine/threonine-protein kinase
MEMNLKEFLKSKLFWRHFIVATVSVIFFLFGCAFFLDMYTLHDKHVKVPNFEGIYVKDLEKFVEGYDLHFEVVDSIYNLKSTKGTVVDQDPKPGATVKNGRTVYLTVNAILSQKVAMPNLVDLSLRQSTSLLETYGLKVGMLRYVEGLPPVIEQLYKGKKIVPGTMIDKGSEIDLVLGRGGGRGLIPVPDLFGLTITEARVVLSNSNLVLGSFLPDATGQDTTTAKIYKQTPAINQEGLYSGASIDVLITGSEEVLENEKTAADTLD